MTKLSGLVAILDEQGEPTGEVRDLGPVPADVKPGRVLPLDDVKPTLAEGEVYGATTLRVERDKVVREWQAVTPEPEGPSLEDRVEALETKVAELVDAKLARG